MFLVFFILIGVDLPMHYQHLNLKLRSVAPDFNSDASRGPSTDD